MSLRVSLTNLLNEHEVANALGLKVHTLRRWRLLSKGPKYLKLGSAVRYNPTDIAGWIESRNWGGEQKRLGVGR
jgi:predicted DNA-binding transcriptional regulator AlpA